MADEGLQWGQCIVPDWPVPPHVRALVTARAGGVSTGPYAALNIGMNTGDDPVAVNRNRSRLQRLAGRPLRWLNMRHGVAVACLDRVRIDEVAVADAAIIGTSTAACVVTIADCLPVFFSDAAGTVVGVAHAGWRGLSQGVLESTITAMGIVPQSLRVWLGPAIGPDAFEVGDDVRDAFFARDHAVDVAFRPHPFRARKWFADLFCLARLRLVASGVEPHAIYGGGLCTYSDCHRFFSYRRDGITGRMAAVIWLEA